MYVMNSVTSGISFLIRAITAPLLKWIQNDDMLSQGSPRQSLIVVIIVAIQLLVTVAVAHSVIFFLLLTSGDVEQNPGPCQTEGTCTLSINACVYEKLEHIPSSYSLNVPHNTAQ